MGRQTRQRTHLPDPGRVPLQPVSVPHRGRDAHGEGRRPRHRRPVRADRCRTARVDGCRTRTREPGRARERARREILALHRLPRTLRAVERDMSGHQERAAVPMPATRSDMDSPAASHDLDRPKRAYVETYGCQMNVADGELMQGILAARGYELVDTPEEADVILVNTCAVRDHAEQRVLGRVAQLNGLKRERPGLVIGVTGCMAQRMGETLLDKAPYVDLVMGPDGYRRLPEALAGIEGAREAPSS